MKNKTHPHHKLINEWCMDMSKHIQIDVSAQSSIKWASAGINEVLSDFSGDELFRFKPSELVDGEWYPCLYGESVSVCMWNGRIMVTESDDDVEGTTHTCFDKIGESLGKIEF